MVETQDMFCFVFNIHDRCTCIFFKILINLIDKNNCNKQKQRKKRYFIFPKGKVRTRGEYPCGALPEWQAIYKAYNIDNSSAKQIVVFAVVFQSNSTKTIVLVCCPS